MLPDEEDSVLPAVETSPEPEEGEHHLSGFEQTGVAAEDDIAAVGSPQTAADAVDSEHGVVAEEGELDLTPGMLDKNNDPVRLYLREMGTVPLLKQENRSVRSGRADRRGNREQDTRDSSSDREDRTAVCPCPQAGQPARKYAEIEQAGLFAPPEPPGPDASTDVAACAID